ncbi:MAG: nucleotidyltransferase substrate binding protein, partial [Planctomycetota bacterium]|nr:nucleotidyltransferase substrate binding protein [Planctomycetota bacterium]
MRAARDAGMLDDGETERALAMVDDRNLTVHTYNEELAQAIYARLPSSQPLSRRVIRVAAIRAIVTL